MIDLFFIDITGVSNFNFKFPTTETFLRVPKKIYLQKMFFPDIHAIIVFVKIVPGAGVKWLLSPDYLHFIKYILFPKMLL